MRWNLESLRLSRLWLESRLDSSGTLAPYAQKVKSTAFLPQSHLRLSVNGFKQQHQRCAMW